MIFQYLCGLLVIFVGIESLNLSLEENRYRFEPRVCNTDDCYAMADVILSAMNRSAEPCEDFYEYACGAWVHSNGSNMPSDQATWNRMEMYSRKLSEKLRTILESTKMDATPVEMAKRWYRSCMNEEALNRRGIKPLTSIAGAVGGWPVAMALGQWDPSDYTWQEIEIYYSRIMGSYAMYKLVIASNMHNENISDILLTIPHLPLSNNLQVARKIFDPQDREPYARLIAGVAKIFATAEGDFVSDGKIAKEVNDMIEFEIQLDKCRDTNAIATANISTIQQLLDMNMSNKSDVSHINIFKLVKNLVEGVGGVEITENETINVEVLYLTQLGELLEKTSYRTIVNYIHWHYLSRVLHVTNSEMGKLLFEFIKDTFGLKQQLPRWEQCVNQLKLNHALSYQFVKEYFTENTFNSASEMILNIQREMEKQINGSSWMDAKTKQLMAEKLWNIKALIGSPNWYKNSTAFEKYYEGLTISNNYFNNLLKYKRFAAKKMIQSLRVANSEKDWLTDPITINAFYIINSNSLNIPAADFQAPLFTQLMPESVKYGIVGSILGHELSHGFDDTGCHFDKNGDIINWPAEMLGAYTLRSRCFVQQYRNLTNATDTNMEVLGHFTIDENIADTTGVQSVFGAYQSIVEGVVKGDRKLPGFEAFNNEQLFFLSFATIWCEMSTPEYERKKLLIFDPHSPARFRVIATMSNIEGFAKAFNCPEGSPMNPRNKCNIWTGKPIGSRIHDD